MGLIGRSYFATDNREKNAVIYHILEKICKTDEEEASLDDLKWIIDVTNYRMAKKYWMNVLNYDYLTWISDSKLNLNTFKDDWQFEYHYENNKIIIDNNGFPVIRNIIPYATHRYYLSEAAIEELDRAILKWKIYGRFLVKFDILLFRLKQKFKLILKGWINHV